jgi:hypothetical protein
VQPHVEGFNVLRVVNHDDRLLRVLHMSSSDEIARPRHGSVSFSK